MTVANLFARIGLKIDEGKAKSFDQTMKTVKVTMIAATAAATGLSLLIQKIASDAMDAAAALRQFEAETGASAQSLQKWESVAEQMNTSAESVSASIRAIADNQQQIKLGAGNISGYQLLGIDPNQDPFEILEQLRTKTVGLSDAMKKTVLSQMGVSAQLIQTLSLSREEFDAMASRSFIISPAAIQSLNDMKSSMDLAQRAIGYIKAQIATSLSPEITDLTAKFSNFIKVNEEGIIQGFKIAYQYISRFVQAITTTARMIDWLVRSTVGWEKAIKGLAIGWVALNTIMAASPMGLITAGIILLIALLDDLYVYSQGGQSMFGVLLQEFPELERVVNDMVGPLSDVIQTLAELAQGDLSFFDRLTEKWGRWGLVVKDVYDILTGLSSLNVDFMTNWFMPFVEAVRAVNEADEGKFGAFFRGLQEGVGNTMLGEALQNPALPGFLGGNTNNTSNNVTINVNGSDDPNTVADRVKGYLQRQLNGASAQRGRDE